MKMKVLVIAAILFSIFSAASSAATLMVALEEAIESEVLEVRMSKDLTGIVKGSRCDGCEMVLVKITPKTKLTINGFVTVLENANKCAGKPGTAIYNIETREVRSISCER